MQTATILVPNGGGQAAVGLPAAGRTAGTATFLATSQNLGTLPAEARSRLAAPSGADEEAAQNTDTPPPAVKPAAQETESAPEGARPQKPATPPAVPETTDDKGSVRADEPCDAYFASPALLADPDSQDWESSPSTQLALTAVLLGAYWGERARPGEERKRRTW
jgi:hypothetical protein